MLIHLYNIHGLIRGSTLEIGRDADNGGQTVYVMELARERYSWGAHVDRYLELVEENLNLSRGVGVKRSNRHYYPAAALRHRGGQLQSRAGTPQGHEGRPFRRRRGGLGRLGRYTKERPRVVRAGAREETAA